MTIFYYEFNLVSSIYQEIINSIKELFYGKTNTFTAIKI